MRSSTPSAPHQKTVLAFLTLPSLRSNLVPAVVEITSTLRCTQGAASSRHSATPELSKSDGPGAQRAKGRKRSMRFAAHELCFLPPFGTGVRRSSAFLRADLEMGHCGSKCKNSFSGLQASGSSMEKREKGEIGQLAKSLSKPKQAFAFDAVFGISPASPQACVAEWTKSWISLQGASRPRALKRRVRCCFATLRDRCGSTEIDEGYTTELTVRVPGQGV